MTQNNIDMTLRIADTWLIWIRNKWFFFFAGLPSDWYPNLDALKESCRIASSYNWADVDLSPFQGAVFIMPKFYYVTIWREYSVTVALTCYFVHHVLNLVFKCSQNGFELLWVLIAIKGLIAIMFIRLMKPEYRWVHKYLNILHSLCIFSSSLYIVKVYNEKKSL